MKTVKSRQLYATYICISVVFITCSSNTLFSQISQTSQPDLLGQQKKQEEKQQKLQIQQKLQKQKEQPEQKAQTPTQALEGTLRTTFKTHVKQISDQIKDVVAGKEAQAEIQKKIQKREQERAKAQQRSQRPPARPYFPPYKPFFPPSPAGGRSPWDRPGSGGWGTSQRPWGGPSRTGTKGPTGVSKTKDDKSSLKSQKQTPSSRKETPKSKIMSQKDKKTKEEKEKKKEEKEKLEKTVERNLKEIETAMNKTIKDKIPLTEKHVAKIAQLVEEKKKAYGELVLQDKNYEKKYDKLRKDRAETYRDFLSPHLLNLATHKKADKNFSIVVEEIQDVFGKDKVRKTVRTFARTGFIKPTQKTLKLPKQIKLKQAEVDAVVKKIKKAELKKKLEKIKALKEQAQFAIANFNDFSTPPSGLEDFVKTLELLQNTVQTKVGAQPKDMTGREKAQAAEIQKLKQQLKKGKKTKKKKSKKKAKKPTTSSTPPAS